MIITIKSYVPYLTELNGTYELSNNQTTIKHFLESLGVKWDKDALVILNNTISNGSELLDDKAQIELLVPIAGG